jgi:hypothetical protein
MKDNQYNRLVQQTIDILIYDYKNKYNSLKLSGLNQEDIDKYMDEYQKIRAKNFMTDLKNINEIYKK